MGEIWSGRQREKSNKGSTDLNTMEPKTYYFFIIKLLLSISLLCLFVHQLFFRVNKAMVEFVKWSKHSFISILDYLQCLWKYYSKLINQNLTPCLILIREDHFNLSTMLNLKGLWMYRARLHPSQSIIHKQTKHELCMCKLILMQTNFSKGVGELFIYVLHTGVFL